MPKGILTITDVVSQIDAMVPRDGEFTGYAIAALDETSHRA